MTGAVLGIFRINMLGMQVIQVAIADEVFATLDCR